MTSQAHNLQEKNARALLRQILSGTAHVDSNKLDALVNLFEMVSYKRNHKFAEEGKLPEHFYFIVKGLVRIYFYLNDKLVIERFEKEEGFFGGSFSHINIRQRLHIYESVEDVTVLRIKYTDLDQLCKVDHTSERVYRIMMEAVHTAYVERLTFFKSLNSEDRYHEFIQKYGDIANRASLKDIANFLEMTPETLSRIRSKYDKR